MLAGAGLWLRGLRRRQPRTCCRRRTASVTWVGLPRRHRAADVNRANRRRARLCALALLGALSLPLAAASAEESPIEAFLAEFTTMAADFEQRLLGASGELLENSSGTVRLRRPGMFSWLYREPYVQQIVSDGETLWVYEEDLEQVTISDAPAAAGDSPILALHGGFNVPAHYEVTQLDNEDGLSWWELTPKDPQAQYRALRLAFAGNELRRITLLDGLGQQVLLTLRNIRRNPRLDLKDFQFVPAPGVDVIDARANARQGPQG